MFAGAPDDDTEAEIEAVIANARSLLGEDGFGHIRQQALESITPPMDLPFISWV